MNLTAKPKEGLPRVEELKDLLKKCVRCGKCRSVCPVFQAVGTEPSVARGKVALLEALLGTDRGGWTQGAEEVLSLCLLCGRCSANCPNGADPRGAVELARAILASTKGLGFLKRQMGRLAAMERGRRDRWLKGAGELQRIISLAGLEGRGLAVRLWGNLWMPRLQMPFFLERISQRPRSNPSGSAKVALFVGCSIHYLAPQVGEATVGVLDSLGIEVHIPKDQGCCGLIAWGMGDEERATLLAKRFVEGFSSPKEEAIVAPCASCAAHLAKGVPALLKGTELEQRAVEVSSKVRELSSLVAERGFLGDRTSSFGSQEGEIVTYHDPCHLVAGLGVREEPRELLRGLSRYSFREMEGGDLCCGMGGSFKISHPDVSFRISQRKLESIRATKARVVTTTCMGCWLQLQELGSRNGLGIRVAHISELLWEEVR